MKILEYRIILPVSVEEYHRGQLWSVNEASKENTGGGDGIEIRKNEAFTGQQIWKSPDGVDFNSGQFTYKIYYLHSKAPGIVKRIFSEEALQLEEKAWNCFPYCRTVFSNPHYMKDNLVLSVESVHLNDRGTTQNAHGLTPDELKQREIITIDIANDPIAQKDYLPQYDPKKIRSEVTGRGPLDSKDWIQKCEPVMCCYKLVKFKFKWFGMQSIVESQFGGIERRIFFLFHRQVYCWLDKWHGVSMVEIRALEEKAIKELEDARKQDGHKGFGAD